MSTRSMRLVVPVALAAVALAGCGNEGSTTSESVAGHLASASASTSTVTVTATPTEATATSTTESAQPATEASTEATDSATPTGSATPTATSSDATDTTDGFGSAAPTPKGSRSAVEAARGQGSPDVQGEAGGGLTVDGVEVGRGTGSTASVWKTLGAPSQPVTSCRSDGATFERHTYGGLEIYVPTTPVGGEYGRTYPVGQVSGWRITGPASGTIKATGPDGTTLGTSLATLKERFTVGQWDSASVATVGGVRRFSIFAGDTTGASFTLGGGDTVVAMQAGAGCS